MEDAMKTVSSLGAPVAAILEQVTIHKKKQSAKTGKDSENKFELYLNQHFKNCQITSVGGQKKYTDFKHQKAGRPDVLLELKDWGTNVATRDVTTFEDSVHKNKTHAIMISMRSGIYARDDLEFRIIDNRYVALYLVNVDWDMTRIEAALNLVYSLEEVLKVGDEEGNICFTPEVIAQVTQQVTDFQSSVLALFI